MSSDWRRRFADRVRPAFKAFLLLAVVGLVSLDSTLLLARRVGAPFMFWFPDTLAVLAALVGALLVYGIVWDTGALAVGFALSRRGADGAGAADGKRWWMLWRRRGFFSLGPWPFTLSLTGGFFVLGTSNITQISLKLLESTTSWRDDVLWDLEEPLLLWVTSLEIPVSAWDLLYHNAWTIEAAVLFSLMVLSRSRVTVLRFFISFMLLYYSGRMLGLLNPVMGPAFYRPEHFAYLQGSTTAQLMELIHQLMSAGPGGTWRSGILLGGVSAMPSLHVGMVSLTAYWLGRSVPWTLYLAVPWVLMVWMSTVALGWHYALDGLGGIALAAVCIPITHLLMRPLKLEDEVPRRDR